jgi:hypothetical protein
VERGGDDLVEVFTELSEENDLAETLGLQLGDGQASVNAAKATQLTESVKEANEEVANA